MVNWHVVVPVYNEADHLENILETLLPLGYSHKVTFVNDASTDASGKILDTWAPRLQCKVVHLKNNAKKEGAICAALEELSARNALPEYTILLDADSFMDAADSGQISDLIDDAIGHLETNNVTGMAFRIEAIVPPGLSPLQWCIYADYEGVQFDNWLTSKYGVMWVINGPGGIFASDQLLLTLQSMTPDFETGDLQITVSLMKKELKVGFWPKLTVKTFVPSSYREYFQQRRRWERGTIKVLWAERTFYMEQFKKRKILAFYTLLYLIFPLGIAALPMILAFADSQIDFLLKSLAWNYVFWVFVTGAKSASNSWSPRDRIMVTSFFWPLLNGVLFPIATGPARLVGFCDALIYVLRNQRKLDKPSVS